MAARHIIVSPSGKLYGSEQVLLDYLKFSNIKFSIFVAGRDLLYQKLKEDFKNHSISHFESVRILYIKLLFLCLTGKVASIYVNEAGHSKYVSLLARRFPSVKFVIHVRLIEDTPPDRWLTVSKPSNLVVLSISQFLKNMLPLPSLQIYDPYNFHSNPGHQAVKQQGKLNIGIIGRISLSKGLDTIIKLLEIVKGSSYYQVFRFHFFGDVMPDAVQSGRYERLNEFSNVDIRGFEHNVEKIYDSLDCVIHGSGNEPLGRIFLEAIDFGKPLVGMNTGGIGEIGKMLQLDTLLIDKDKGDASELLFAKLLHLHNNYESSVAEINSKKNNALNIFGPVEYAATIDSLLCKSNN